MFTVKQAAQELSLSISLVYALVAAGKIRHERHGMGRGVIRIPKEALDEYRKQSTVTGATSAAPALKLKHLKLSPS